MAFVNNFSTSFRYLDFLFGTDDKYREHKAKMAKMKAGATSQEERDAIELKINEEFEKAGLVAEAAAESKRPWW